jgi:hypothetical protein
MFTPQCPFCDHANPASAKFCNDCGSPLHLRPCKQCEAINNQAATNCYKCGAEFPISVATVEAAPVAPAPNTPAASAILSDVGLEHGHSPLPEAVAENYDVGPRQPGKATARDREPGVEVVTREPRSLVKDVISLFSGALRATYLVPLPNLGATAGRRPMSRVALAALLPALLLTAVAISAYLAYRHPPQLGERLNAMQPDAAAPADGNPSVSPVTLGTGSVAAIRSTRPITPNESSSDVITSPVIPRARIATSDQAPPAQPLATQAEAEGVVGAPGTATTTTAEPRRKTIRAAGNQAAPRDSAANRSRETPAVSAAAAPAESPLGDSRANVPPDVLRPSACTEAVAALGLCNQIPRRE